MVLICISLMFSDVEHLFISSGHTCTSLGGHGLLGQEPAFLGPRWGVAANISHIPPQGQAPSLHWFFNVTASLSPH